MVGGPPERREVAVTSPVKLEHGSLPEHVTIRCLCMMDKNAKVIK